MLFIVLSILRYPAQYASLLCPTALLAELISHDIYHLTLTLIHKYPELPNGVLATSSFPKFKGKVGIGFCFDPGSLGEDM